MPAASLLKTIATQNKTYAQKSASPHERIIDRIKSVRVDRFEKVGEQMSVVGTDLATSEKVRMFRDWSRSPRVKEVNPLEKAPDTVEPGGVIMFTDVRRITGIDGEDTFSSDGFVTVSRNATREEAEVIHDVEAFVDAPESLENGDLIQMFNIVRTEEASKTTTPEEFFQAFKTFLEERGSAEDSVVIRGFSEADGMSSSIRVFVGPNETFRDRMTRFLDEDHYIEMAGEIEGTYEVNGRDLVASLKDPENDTLWEVIPVSVLRKRLTVRNDPEFSRHLEEKAALLFQNFVHMGDGALTGCRKVSLGLRHSTYGSGARFSDVVSAFHAPGKARPLAMIDTPHVNGLDKVFPGYGNDRIYTVGDDEPDMDFSAYIDDLAGELQAENMDFLDQPGLPDVTPNAAPDTAADTPAEESMVAPQAEEQAVTPASDDLDIDLSLFEPDAPEEESEPTEAAQAAEDPEAAEEQNPDPEKEQDGGTAPAPEEDGDLEVNLSELPDENADPESDPDVPDQPEAGVEADDDDLNIDLSALDDMSASEEDTPSAEEATSDPAPVASENTAQGGDEPSDDLTVDLSSLEPEADTPEPAATAETVTEPASAPKSEPEPEDQSVGFVDLGDADADAFEVDDFLAEPEPDTAQNGQDEEPPADLEVSDQSLASDGTDPEQPKDSDEKKSESEELIEGNFDAIAGALKF
ncbi:hypothetical protein [Salipiger mucosus]|uniref:Uncharacterized protein n=1 Tax=Salipiger mucosus DSM 16094 TaxID=1123237 RepID=S9SCT5_9RHOB|nr:hypothetical protein [Salipiger mucosus]EPX84039.1 hypothetical protein Salmuc_01814 [Salipiger mucosus DSM 16094]